ncbi:oligosaccharide flippase family protein [Shewanella scandinavica]|uniref:oligosaccharide flippase family protein n=1 Tax=Shewanella scandinavica TaxID=3063538 RepID=UPI00319144AE
MLKNIGILTAANVVINIIVSMAVGVLISRGLSVEDRGTVFLSFQVALICSVVITFGASQSIVYFQRDIKEEANKAFVLSTICLSLLTLMIFLFKNIISLAISEIFSIVLPKDTYAIFIGSIIAMVIFAIFYAKVQIEDNGIELSLLISIFGNLLYIVIFYVAYILHLLTIKNCITIFFASYIIRFLTTIYWARNLKWAYFKFESTFIKKFTECSALFWINVVFFIIFSKINLLIAGKYLDRTDLGIYSVSLTVIEIVCILPSAIGTVLFPYMVKSGFAENDDRLQTISRLMFEIALCGSLIVFCFGYILIVFLYGSAYSDAYWPLIIMLPGSVMLSVVFSFTNYLNSTGKTKQSNYTYLMCIFLSLLISIPLIDKYHIYGASISYTICCFITFISFLYLCNNGFSQSSKYLIGNGFRLEIFTQFVALLKRK